MTRQSIQRRHAQDSNTEQQRGIAVQFDLLLMVTLITVSFSVFMVYGVSLLGDIQNVSHSDEINNLRGVEMLTDDHLVDPAMNTTLDRSCTEAYFDKSPDSSCGHNPSWDDDTYLSDSLPHSIGAANISIVDGSGTHVVLNGVELALGNAVHNHEDVTEQTVYVSLDANGDGDTEIYRLIYKTW